MPHRRANSSARPGAASATAAIRAPGIRLHASAWYPAKKPAPIITPVTTVPSRVVWDALAAHLFELRLDHLLPALGTNAVAELRRRVLPDVVLHSLPVMVVRLDLLAVAADRQDPLELFHV